MSVRPCVYPGCDRDNGDPELTDLGVCEHCQRRLRRCLENLVTYWAFIHTDMPAPAHRDAGSRHGRSTSFGHPAEWASDMADEIAAKLNWTHDVLADNLGDNPPPHDHAREAIRIRAAWRYLEPRIDRLSLLADADHICIELVDLASKVRGALGQTRARVWLKGVPCMQCGTAALTMVDADLVECGGCLWTTTHERFGLLARHAIDIAIDAYDQQHADTSVA